MMTLNTLGTENDRFHPLYSRNDARPKRDSRVIMMMIMMIIIVIIIIITTGTGIG